MMDLKDLVRPNIWALKPYSSARDEFHGSASVFLDANENPYNEPYNRYPDPLQWELHSVTRELIRLSVSLLLTVCMKLLPTLTTWSSGK